MFRYILLFLVMILSVSFQVSNGYAEGKYQIKQMTPEVNSALENRRSRFDQLRDLKSKGIVGETNRGYVKAIESIGDAESLVQAENDDRKIIYKTIAQQNGLEGALETIEKVFAQVQRDKAESGDKVQQEDGSWTTK
jgi:uncharacterized protein YdbL (DUF1318 family)